MNNLLTKLNPEQLAAVTHSDGPLLIVAGAGTGKTTVITERIAYLIREKGIKVATGVFQEMMEVYLVNDGPVTLLLDSQKAL